MKKAVVTLFSLAMIVSAMPSAMAAQAESFRDVPVDHWAYEEIDRAVDRGIINGYGDGTFGPSNPVTNAHFSAIIARAYFPDDLEQADSLSDAQSGWWYGSIVCCDKNGLLDGTVVGKKHSETGEWGSEVNSSMSRYDMAQVMYNLLRNQGAKMPSGSQQTAVQSSIKDWSSIPDSYQTAVSVCYALGLLNGQADGTFGGNNSMNRAQACVVIDRLNQYLTGSNPQQGQNWTRVVNGKEVSYECSLKGTSYRSYPSWRPTLDANNWGLVKLNQSQRDASWVSWQYQYGDGTITFRCSYRTDASFGCFMQTEDAVNNCQEISIQGYSADFYTDGSNYLLVWENEDGVLFMLDGVRVNAEIMKRAAESVQPYDGAEIQYTLDWRPSGYSYFDQVDVDNASQQMWVDGGKSLVLLYTTDSVAEPDGSFKTVEVNGNTAKFWAATEPLDEDDGKQTGGNTTSSSATIPGMQSKEYSTLVWTDPESGVSFRLQSAENMESMIRMAEAIKE